MRVCFWRVWGTSVLLGLATACGGSTHNGAPGGSGGLELAGAAGAFVGSAGSSSAGGGGVTSAGAGGLDIGGSGGSTAGGPALDIGPQQRAAKLDVLFVVDNSVLMGDKQAVLAASLPGFVDRLVNPHCVDAQGTPSTTQPASGAASCASGSRELTPVTDMHLGVITTSIGGHGGVVCNTDLDNTHYDDQAELIGAKRANVASYNGSGFLSFDSAGTAGVKDPSSIVSDLQAMVTAAGESGCGYEAPLEAMYRFLVDPDPPQSIKQVNGLSTPIGVNDVLLAERKAFLRPDSALAIVILTDENDCSIRDDGIGWFVGSTSRMPRATSACDSDPNDLCCRSCAQNETNPPPGCVPLADDATCQTVTSGVQYATWDSLHDSLNLRCYEQRARFGFDLLYPVERYYDALSNPKITNRAGTLVDNPLLAGRSATLISVSTIVGVPWQDLATKASITAAKDIQYLPGSQLATQGRWAVVLGDPSQNQPPTDAFMNESIAERTGDNPLTQIEISPASSQNPRANPINGHEQNIPNFDDLQYACTFLLPTPRLCVAQNYDCDCSPDNQNNTSYLTAANSPVCQPPAGGPAGTTQYYARAYPGARELRFSQLLGERAAPGSICPKALDDAASADFGYGPVFSALLARIATTLK